LKIALKILLTCLLCIVFCVVVYIIAVLGYSTISEFEPKEVSILNAEGQADKNLQDSTEISLLTWNLGYGGLGKEMDFFYEGGKMVRPSKELNAKYLSGIENFISSVQDVDFLLLQEVDFKSKRSYSINQYQRIKNILANHNSVKALNYKSWFVPIQIFEPMGKVLSGMAIFSKNKSIDAKRIATPGSHTWPKKLFMLKRCFVYAKYEVSNGKELIIINLHNSAFDDERELRKVELEMLKALLIEEYEKGNYVIAGGDWNQNPVGFKDNGFHKYLSKINWPIDPDYLPNDWNWASDYSTPTNRGVQFPFDINKTETTILDYFVTSPNVEVIEVKTIDLGFEDSDHHPIMIRVRLVY